MRDHDKVIIAVGIAILVVASVGIFFYKPSGAIQRLTSEKIACMMGILRDAPSGIEVSDKNPFYPLILTPLAIHYDREGNREVIPLYVKNMTNPSKAVIRTELLVGKPIDLLIDGSKDPEQVSLEIAERYWKKADIALILKDGKEGYIAGLPAIPIASYLTIPVIVTDKMDSKVSRVLGKLGVKYLLICGNISADGYSSYKIKSPDDALNLTISVVEKKFGEVEYITLANPLDAWPPRVLDSVTFSFGPEEVKSATMTGNQLKFLLRFLMGVTKWNFTIPEDYKYALIEFEGINHEVDGVDKFGDEVTFTLEFPYGEDESYVELAPLSTYAGIAERDASGRIVKDSVYAERVLYDYGGKTIRITVRGRWALHDVGKVSARVVVKKLDNPLYPMAKSLSSLAPYLTAYHRGILFARPDFAFAADDHVVDKRGRRFPGYYMPGLNPSLVPLSNEHVFKHIHEPLNKLLARLRDIPYTGIDDLKILKESYMDDPVYIAIVGDPTVLPRYFIEDIMEPLNDTGIFSMGGGGIQTDNIYGDIDPVEGDWSNCAQDACSEYPEIENMVGRLFAWDTQDLSALIVRTVFYNDIIYNMQKWKDSVGIIVGGGLDFAKPLPLYIISKLMPSLLKKLMHHPPFIDLEGPWKYETGFGDILAEALRKRVGEELGFSTIEVAKDNEGLLRGLSDDALREIKRKSLRNLLVFNIGQVRSLAGESVAKGKEIVEGCNLIFIAAHGSQHLFSVPGPRLVAAGFDGYILNTPRLWQKILECIIPVWMIGFWGPGGDLGKVGDYTPRSISNLNLGPSVLWLDSCFCGKINGMHPRETIPGAFMHAGLNALIASTTSSNIAGGYLEPKKHMWDTLFSTWRAYRNAKMNAKKGIFPDFHFGPKIFYDMCVELSKNKTIGRAFRDAKNNYLPYDADWELWWSPPLSANGEHEKGYGKHLHAKYTSFYEYCLYGDPAFNPYMPGESE